MVEQARVEVFADTDQQHSEYADSRMSRAKAEIDLEYHVLRRMLAEVIRAEKRSKIAQLQRDHNNEILKKREELLATMPELQEERKAVLDTESRSLSILVSLTVTPF